MSLFSQSRQLMSPSNAVSACTERTDEATLTEASDNDNGVYAHRNTESSRNGTSFIGLDPLAWRWRWELSAHTVTGPVCRSVVARFLTLARIYVRFTAIYTHFRLGVCLPKLSAVEVLFPRECKFDVNKFPIK